MPFSSRSHISVVPTESVSDTNQQNEVKTLEVLRCFSQHRRGITYIENETCSGTTIWLAEHSSTITLLDAVAPT